MAFARLPLAEPDACELRVDEQTGRHLPTRRHSAAAGEVVADDAEVVEGDVCEVRAAGAVAHCPNALGCGLEPLIDFHVPGGVRLDAGPLQPDAIGVRGTSAGGQ